ncbi:uncharacterized protein [Palaemon carinicauda]|uniref:uncharacterized protein n=1 Tax=Palaemon carinicauda TaxID=392227 RepID=UPI0035B61874
MRASVLIVAIALVCSVAANPEPHRRPSYGGVGVGGVRPVHGVGSVHGGVGGAFGGLGGVSGGVGAVHGVRPVHGGVGGAFGGLGGVSGGVGAVHGVRPVHGVGSVHGVVRPVHTGAIGHGSYGK